MGHRKATYHQIERSRKAASAARRLAATVVVAGLALAATATAFAQVGTSPEEPRLRRTINEGWKFHPDGVDFAMYPSLPDAGWERVSIPHTWNAFDPFDDEDSYRRGISWYRKPLRLNQELRGRRLYLYFEGVNQEADVYVNGAYAGSHRGGYTAFAIDVTEFVTFGDEENLIAVQVDNSHNPAIPPLSVGFALYGGIYRDVWLIATDPVHFAVTDRASPGVFVSTPIVSDDTGVVRIRGTIANDDVEPRSLRVMSEIRDRAGSVVGRAESLLTLNGDSAAHFEHEAPPIERPRLWSPSDPYLYSVTTDVIADDVVLDRVRSPLGFRWFGFDPQNGFSLNGEKLQLRGTNRHQDYQGLGSALTNELHVRDMEWIKQMGANFVRLAHYPQDPAVLEAADRLGLLVWEEIPLVNYMTVSPEFVENSIEMLREMIRQHYNHPSVIIWGSMNEIFLWSEQGARIRSHTDRKYASKVLSFAQALDSTIRAEDPDRYSAMAIHGSGWYDETGVDDVAQILGLNMYSGWYNGTFEGFGNWLDNRHARNPGQVLFVSEYGAGSDGRINALEPERFDFSGNWARLYHEAYLRQMNERPYLGGTAIWNQFDFSQPHTGGTIPHLNQKGVQTWDRRPKDAYFLYKANWADEPMVYIASRDWDHRAGSGRTPIQQPVDIYSNLNRVELIANGRSLGARTPDEVRKATWQVPLVPGENVLEARGAFNGRIYTDRLSIHLDHRPESLSDAPFRQIAVNVGSGAQYVDAGGVLWDADRPYREGSFGYVEGEAAMFDKDIIIEATTDTPLFFTYRSGLSAYKFDVPDGTYVVELRFAEPTESEAGRRVFDVSINDDIVLDEFDPVHRGGNRQAMTVSHRTSVTQGEGLAITFTNAGAEPILNAVQITRN